MITTNTLALTLLANVLQALKETDEPHAENERLKFVLNRMQHEYLIAQPMQQKEFIVNLESLCSEIQGFISDCSAEIKIEKTNLEKG